jgi:hypothetical protein
MTTVALRVLLSLVAVLIAIAFYTLWERKAMGASHRRFGPVLVGWFGLLQPVADGLKLAVKEFIAPKFSVSILFILTPPAVMTLSLVAWGLIPFSASEIENVLLEIRSNGAESALRRGLRIAQALQDSHSAPADVGLGLEFDMPPGVFIAAVLCAAVVCGFSWLSRFRYQVYKEKDFPFDARANISETELLDPFLLAEHVRQLMIYRGASTKWASKVAEISSTRRGEQGWDLLHTHPWVIFFFGVLVTGLAVGVYWNTFMFAGLVTTLQNLVAALTSFTPQARKQGQVAVDGINDLVSLEGELNRHITAVWGRQGSGVFFSTLETSAVFLPVALLLTFAAAFLLLWLASRGRFVSALFVLLSRRNLLFLSRWRASYAEYVTWDGPISSHS